MNSLDSLTKENIIDLLNRCWMTHDGMWFFLPPVPPIGGIQDAKAAKGFFVG